MFFIFFPISGRTEREIIADMKRVDRVSTGIHRTYSITSAPPSIRTLGRSNTAPLPHQESPERSTYYHNRGFQSIGDKIGFNL